MLVYKIDKLPGLEPEIPEMPGVYELSHNDEVLYLNKTLNLRNSAKKFTNLKLAKDGQSGNYMSLLERADTFTMYKTSSLFNALLLEKKKIHNAVPEFNNLIKPFFSYVYLALNLFQSPFFRITEDTLENYVYIGPFRNRFEVIDIIDSFAELLKLPNCCNPPVPCERLKKNLCKAYCVKGQLDNISFIDDAVDYYLKANDKIIDKLESEYKFLFNDLQFNKANNMKHGISKIKKYYEYLKFFSLSKSLNLIMEDEEGIYEVRGGLLSVYYNKIKPERRGFSLDTVESYNENEFLAYDKKELDERLILFNHLVKGKGVKIKDENGLEKDLLRELSRSLNRVTKSFEAVINKNWRIS